jgi:hypothetical protein
MARRAHTQGIPGVIWRLDEPSGSLIESVSPSWGVSFYPPFATSWHFKFNGNVDNSAPYDGGTIDVFGAPTYVAGKVGSQAISLNGTSDYLETAASWYALYANKAFSFAAWVNPGSGNAPITGLGRTIFHVGETGGNVGVALHYDSTNSRFELSYGASTHQTAGSYPHTNWYHVVVTYDGATITLYIDNVSVFSTPVSLNKALAPLTIGRDHFIPNQARYYHGLIDDCRLYHYGTLTAAHVAELWNSGNGTEAELADDGAPTPTAVVGEVFNYARTFTRSQKRYAETFQPVLHTFVPVQAITCWVRLASLPSAGAEYPIFSRWNTGSTSGFVFSILESGGDIILRLKTGDGVSTSNLDYVATGFNTSDWFLLGAYAFEGTRSLYINGVLVAQDTGEDIVDDRTGSVSTLGGIFDAGGGGRIDHYFDGMIADVCFSGISAVNNVASIWNSRYDLTLGLRPQADSIACYNFESPDPTVDEVGSHPMTITEYPGSWFPDHGVVSLGTIFRITPGVSLFTIPHHADFNGGEDPICIEVFFAASGTLGGGTILQKYDGTSAPFILYIDTDYIVARVQDSFGEFAETTSLTTLPNWDPVAPTVRQSNLMYAAITWSPKTKTVGLSFNGNYTEASNSAMDLTAIGNISDVVGALGYNGSGEIRMSNLRFNRGVKKGHELQSTADGRRFNV